MGNKQMSFNMKVALTGFFGGLIWSLAGYFVFYFNFVRIGPAFIFMPFTVGAWRDTAKGQYIGVLVIAFLSIGIAFLYKVAFQRIHNIWMGIAYGFILWLLVFYLLNPLFHGLKPFYTLDKSSLITTLCLFILYGTFIGYSISYEHAQQQQG